MRCSLGAAGKFCPTAQQPPLIVGLSATCHHFNGFAAQGYALTVSQIDGCRVIGVKAKKRGDRAAGKAGDGPAN